MLKPHIELLATLARAEKQAVALEVGGANVMAVIHHVRSAGNLVQQRVAAYTEAPAAPAPTEAPPAPAPTEAPAAPAA